MICQGVPVRFPKLRFAFLEIGATWLPYYLDRLDEHWEKRAKHEMPLLKEKPSDLVRKSKMYFSLESGESLLPESINYLGAEHFLYASDIPAASTSYPAMGQRVRLKASFVIPDNWTIEEKAVLRALKKYGALVADNASLARALARLGHERNLELSSAERPVAEHAAEQALLDLDRGHAVESDRFQQMVSQGEDDPTNELYEQLARDQGLLDRLEDKVAQELISETTAKRNRSEIERRMEDTRREISRRRGGEVVARSGPPRPRPARGAVHQAPVQARPAARQPFRTARHRSDGSVLGDLRPGRLRRVAGA
jgi:hypothetical protein